MYAGTYNHVFSTRQDHINTNVGINSKMLDELE